MENNVKLDFKKKRSITKKIGDQNFKIKPFISIDEKEYILNTILSSLEKRIKENEGIIPLIMGIEADLDLLVCIICTNVNLEGIKYDDIYNSGFFSIVKENIINYDDIKDAANTLIYLLKITNMLPDLDEKFNIEDIVKDKTPEEISALTDFINTLNKPKE